MAGFYSLDNREVIRVKVEKCEGLMQPEYKKFSIDPQITTFDMLQGILGKAFGIKSDFMLSYLAKDREGQEVYLSMLSEWDMDAAFQCAADPCLMLKVDLKPVDQELNDWDVIAPADISQSKAPSLIEKTSFLSSISSHMGKTMSSMQRAIGLKHCEETFKRLKPPMSDMEFHNYLDSAGFMVNPSEFRFSIFQGGIEDSLRRVAWRHLLCIFPENLSGHDRFDYLKCKEKEYYTLRDEWKRRFTRGLVTDELKYVTSMVKKDVLRTDRKHRLFAGGDDNKNVRSLFHILVTYALTHPDVSYCQGMSDLASPLLVVQKDEAQAYICFCSLMSRLHSNFSADGTAMMTQFRHLAELLQVHDTAFYEYLQSINAHDLFFCYRWLLLQLKREFPFEDALYMLEVMWSTLPPTPPKVDLPLVDPDYNAKLLSSSPCSPSFSFQQSVQTKLLAMRCSNRARDFSVSSSDSTGFQSSKESVQETGSSRDSSCEVCLTEDNQVLDNAQDDNVVTHCFHRRSGTIDELLLECENLTVPSCEHHCLDQDSQESGGDIHRRNLQCSICLQGSSESTSENELNGNVHCSIPQVSTRLSNHCIPDYSERRAIRDKEESTETYSSFINISVEVGTADASSDIEPNSCGSPFDEADKEEQFSLSLDSESASSDDQAKTEGEDEGYSGCSVDRKECGRPDRQVKGSVIPQDVLSNNNCFAARETVSREQQIPRGQSDSGVSDSSWSGAQTTQTSKPYTKPRLPWVSLPPPQHFGNGNPFLMFLCLSLLLQHRQRIMGCHMDYEDVAMFFDKKVRQHNVHRTLHQARELYTDYLHTQQTLAEQRQFELSL